MKRLILKTLSFTAAMPFVGLKTLITGDRRPMAQGAILGAVAVTLLTGMLNTGNAFPVTDYFEALERAANSGALIDDQIILPADGLTLIAYNEDCPIALECVFIPPRKPVGYTDADRLAMNALIERVGQ